MASFTKAEEAEYKAAFDSMDVDHDQFVDAIELAQVLKNLGMYQSDAQVHQLIAEVDANKNGLVEFSEFMKIVTDIKSGAKSDASGFGHVVKEQKKMIQVKGMVGQHSFSQEEMSAFAEHFNHCMRNDPDLDYLMPIDASASQLCDKVHDGVLLGQVHQHRRSRNH